MSESTIMTGILILLFCIFVWGIIDSFLWLRSIKKNKKEDLNLNLPRPVFPENYNENIEVQNIPIQSKRKQSVKNIIPISNEIVCTLCGGTGELSINEQGLKYEFPKLCEKCNGKGKIIRG